MLHVLYYIVPTAMEDVVDHGTVLGEVTIMKQYFLFVTILDKNIFVSLNFV